MNKKGSFMDLFIWLASAMVLVVIFGGFLFFTGKINTVLTGIDTPDNDLGINISEAAENTFGYVDEGAQYLKTLAFIMLFAMVLSMFLSNFLVKSHPIFYGIYVLIVAVAIIFAVVISNAYETILLESNEFTEVLMEFTATNFIMFNLPIWIAVIGIIGGIFLFIGVPRDRGVGGGVT